MVLVVANTDGSGEQTIIDPSLTAIDYEDLGSAQWSPDGQRIAVVITPTGRPTEQRTYVLNADGSGLRPLSRLTSNRSESNAAWSPDGSRIAIQRWLNRADGSVDVRPVTVIDVDLGIETEVGLVSANGYRGWTWSPDGRSIVELSDTGRVTLANAASGEWHEIPPGIDAAITWQRLAPP
jgi:dipeptidyl aminopeptidase/acylaminoacyl peptidase